MPKLNQKGIVHILVIFILLAGIIAGVYLVQHPTFFKPKAYESNSLIPQNQYDNPPPLLVSNSDGARRLLTESGTAAGYSVKINQSEDDITIDFGPQDLTEDKAKDLLNNADIYYLRTLMWLLYDPFNATGGSPIDAWYVLCDHLEQSVLDKVGAEPTTLANGEKLQCSDPIPTYDQFYPTDAHVHFIYKKIPATVLVKMVETAKLQRENKSSSENAKDFAFSMVPILGPTINATRNPGSDPSEVAQATVIDGLLTILFGPGGAVGSETTQLSGKIITSLGSRINARFIIPNFRKIPSFQYADFATEMAMARQQLGRHENLVVKFIGQVTRRDPILKNIVLRMVGTKIGPAVFQNVFADLDVIYSRFSQWELQQVLPVQQIKRSITKHQSNFVNLLDDDYDALLGQGSVGVTMGNKNPLKSKIAIRTANLVSRTSPHEFIHYSQYIHHPDLMAYIRSLDTGEQILFEGLNDWLLQRELGYTPSYGNVVSEVEKMVQGLSRTGVDGVQMARPTALNGNTKWFLQEYEKYTGDFSMRSRLADLFQYWRAKGLIPPIFLLGKNDELDSEDDGIIENEILNIPSVSTASPVLGNYLNCSYSQQDSNCSSGTTVCTGHTPEDKCAGKQPGECFNLVGCAYDVNKGSSCSCI